VTRFGVEFAPISGDPRVLSAYVVRHRGIFPRSLREVREQRATMRDIVLSTGPACTGPDPGPPPPAASSAAGTPRAAAAAAAAPAGSEVGEDASELRSAAAASTQEGFAPDLIVATPAVWGAPHVAEALGVPLHILFTMPWHPTEAFAQPWTFAWGLSLPGAGALRALLAALRGGGCRRERGGGNGGPPGREDSARELSAAAEGGGGGGGGGGEARLGAARPASRLRRWAHRASWHAVERLIWAGVSGSVAELRRSLGLPGRGRLGAAGGRGAGVPTSFMWSPRLAPKPADWPPHVEVTGAPLAFPPLSLYLPRTSSSFFCPWRCS